MAVRRTATKATPARRGRPAKTAPAKSTRSAAKAAPTKKGADVTVYADKVPTDYHKAFARWIVSEVGYDPDSAPSLKAAFLRGVSIATAARPAFMESDFLEEWREKNGVAKRGPKGSTTSTPATTRRTRKAAPEPEVEEEDDEFDEEDEELEDDEFDEDDDSEEDDEDSDEFDDEEDDEEDEEVEETPAPRRGRPRKAAPAKATARKAAPAKATRGRAKATPADDDDFVF